MAYMIDFIKLRNNPTYKDFILNKVNPISQLSTLAYSILNLNNDISVMLVEFGAKCYYNENDE